MNAAKSLKERFLTLVSTGRFAGSENLSELSDMAFEVAARTKGVDRVLAYVLSKVLWITADALNSRPVTLSEAKLVESELTGVVQHAIELLGESGRDTDKIGAAEKLINAQENLNY